MEFLKPVRLDDVLKIQVTVLKKYDRDRILEVDTCIFNQNQQLILAGQGKVKVLVASQPELEASPSPRPRVAIVTGGSGGIGRHICLRLAADGYHVVVNYNGQVNRAAEIESEINSGGLVRAITVQADVSQEAGAESLYRAALNAFGSVSILVNNASPRINQKPFNATTWNDVQYQMDVQVKGAFFMTSAVTPEMAARKWGRIINITSQVIESDPSIGWTGYAMAKGALSVFSRYMAAELGPQGITVNCVAPGMCETKLIGDIPEKMQMMVARQTPLRRLARPSDVAAAVAYLVSEDADFLTGQTISVNGGKVMR
jgi:3-oxoacyl-[acyl-carrier protein] reductase